MTLSDYFAGRHGAQARLAESMSIAPALLSQWASGVRPVPVGRCAVIERETGGQVSRRDLRPDDWAQIWPELAANDPAGQVNNAAHVTVDRRVSTEPNPFPDLDRRAAAQGA